MQRHERSKNGSWLSFLKVIRQGHINNFNFIQFLDLKNVRNDTKITSLSHLHPEIWKNEEFCHFDMGRWHHAWRHVTWQPFLIRALSTRTKIVLWTFTFKLTLKMKLLHKFEMTELTGHPTIRFSAAAKKSGSNEVLPAQENFFLNLGTPL